MRDPCCDVTMHIQKIHDGGHVASFSQTFKNEASHDKTVKEIIHNFDSSFKRENLLPFLFKCSTTLFRFSHIVFLSTQKHQVLFRRNANG